MEEQKELSLKTRLSIVGRMIFVIIVVVIAAFIAFNYSHYFISDGTEKLTAHITYNHVFRYNETVELSAMVTIEGAPIVIKFSNLDLEYYYTFDAFNVADSEFKEVEIGKNVDSQAIWFIPKDGFDYGLCRSDEFIIISIYFYSNYY